MDSPEVKASILLALKSLIEQRDDPGAAVLIANSKGDTNAFPKVLSKNQQNFLISLLFGIVEANLQRTARAIAKIYRYLVDIKSDSWRYHYLSAYEYAASVGKIRIAEILNNPDDFAAGNIHDAAYNGQAFKLYHLLKASPESVNELNVDGQSALYLATIEGNQHCVSVLMNHFQADPIAGIPGVTGKDAIAQIRAMSDKAPRHEATIAIWSAWEDLRSHFVLGKRSRLASPSLSMDSSPEPIDMGKRSRSDSSIEQVTVKDTGKGAPPVAVSRHLQPGCQNLQPLYKTVVSMQTYRVSNQIMVDADKTAGEIAR